MCHTCICTTDIDECAVVGIPDDEYGQIIGAVLVLKKSAGVGGHCVSSETLTRFLKSRLASHSIPRQWKIVNEMPRNAMGKVNKKIILQTFFAKDKKS